MNQDLFGTSVSPGTLENAQQEASARLEPVLEYFTEQLIKAGLIHCDESGMRIGARLHWLHSVGTLLFTLYHCHKKRGKEGMEEPLSNATASLSTRGESALGQDYEHSA